MQHRRLTSDDDKGLDLITDLLNEVEADNKTGMSVNAKYYMQIFDTVKGQSK